MGPREDRMVRGPSRGRGRDPLARVQQAIRSGRVLGLTEKLAREILGDGEAARTAVRITREREPQLRHMEEMRRSVRDMEERRAAATSSTRAARPATPATSRVHAKRAGRATVPAVKRTARARSDSTYIDAEGTVRNALGAPLPAHAQLSVDERQRLRAKRARERMVERARAAASR